MLVMFSANSTIFAIIYLVSMNLIVFRICFDETNSELHEILKTAVHSDIKLPRILSNIIHKICKNLERRVVQNFRDSAVFRRLRDTGSML